MKNTLKDTAQTPATQIADTVASVPPNIASSTDNAAPHNEPAAKAEHGGPKGPEPTRYGDWEKKGKCVDF